jgi:hypothetical protein
MTIKIKAPRAYMSEWTVHGKLMPCEISWHSKNVESGTNKRAVRVVRESDWRKLMELIKAVDDFNRGDDWRRSRWAVVVDALEALEKKK